MSWRSVFLQLNVFQKTAVITIAVTFLLIFIGGLVRASGAGLGCPDWPKCFGLWIPPLDAADLPSGYDPDQFNVFKTWMEYVNRLVGVIVGFLILLTFAFSTTYIRSRPLVFLCATVSLILVLFQGWLGGQVVQSGLQSWLITLHMVTAVLILNMLILTLYLSVKERFDFSLESGIKRPLVAVLAVLLLVTVAQVIFGTQVREALESVRQVYPVLERSEWIDRVGAIDLVHRSFSWVVLIMVLLFQYMVWKFKTGPYLYILAAMTTAATLMQIIFGAGLVYLGLPPSFQVLHLWVAAFMTSVPFVALLIVISSEDEKKGVHSYEN
ncbi:COX15/CtaA family protein [Natronogracilivirga saccharolytica]|uniref:COX15/CtaA family protein n=1 Tax=Natronogracilivirga saccharolytica TaxID=2812953 RepID=A0A8J7RH39_9BACT|nr:COX15/CtaA family protein [Natronogracilivirga saccharolytica]MBP3191092.1 COX15/CtaA family protein [Natronogracilivirga saccharolytica]